MVWSWKKILVSVGCSCTLFMLTTLVSSDQNIFAKMEAITMDFRSFHRIYHEKKVLAESLDQVIMDKRKEEETLEGIMSQLAMGCVTCHACHGCVTDFRPILGNPMEVTHVTSPGHVYIFPC